MIRVTKHALEKYIKNIGRKTVDPEQEILDLFYEAKEETNAGLVKRRIDNPTEDTKYYRNGKWRFVIVEDNMVTMELDTFTSFTGLGFHKTDKQRRSKKEWKWKKNKNVQD
jgi:hypothetical protein